MSEVWKLTAKEIKGSKPEHGIINFNVESILDLIASKIKKDAYAVLWQNDSLLFGKYIKDVGFDFPQAHDFKKMLELRIFNEEEELYLDGASYRYRSDSSDGEETFEVVDTASRLWGEKTSEEGVDGFISLQDTSRKLKLEIPAIGSGDSKYYKLLVRSYIGYVEKTGQAGYVDYRFLGIREGGGY